MINKRKHLMEGLHEVFYVKYMVYSKPSTSVSS
jgi:hypothetical protein